MPDEIRTEATRHYDERQLAALVLMIGVSGVESLQPLRRHPRQLAGAGRQPDGDRPAPYP